MIRNGGRFGMLTVIEQNGKNEKGQRLYRCRCDCGNEIMASGTALMWHVYRCCGCTDRKGNRIEKGETAE